jgi:hypothetical protein
MKNDKYLLAYARKHRNSELIDRIQKEASQRKDPVKARMNRFREALKTARETGNKEMESRVLRQFRETGDVNE